MEQRFEPIICLNSRAGFLTASLSASVVNTGEQSSLSKPVGCWGMDVFGFCRVPSTKLYALDAYGACFASLLHIAVDSQ